MKRKIIQLQQTFAAAVLVLFLSATATASETDQFYGRAEPIADSTEVLNKKFNQKIAKIIARHSDDPRQKPIAYDVYRELGGRRFTDKFEAWLIESPDVEKREVSRGDSIYSGMPVWSTRAVYFFGLGQTINIDGHLVGSDKISHFLSQGWKFYKRYERSGSEEKAARRGVLTERAIFGSRMTGSFSNADLVSNYEGHLFYRSLFEDEVIPGKPAILRWEEGSGWVIQREFDWADHVNAYWDEALNMNKYDRLLRKRMHTKLVNLCPQYWQDPGIYVIENEEALRDRYAHLGMRDTRATRLDNLCLAHQPETAETLVAANVGWQHRSY